jgi:hypothetical protein
MYTKEITQLIVYYWGKGQTAEQTVQSIQQLKNIRLGLATVYRRRNSLTAKTMIDELQRQQQQDITESGDTELKLKYRNELLKILLPQKIEANMTALPKILVEIVDNVKFKQDNVPVASKTAASTQQQ